MNSSRARSSAPALRQARPLGRPDSWAAVFVALLLLAAVDSAGRTIPVQSGPGVPISDALRLAHPGDVVEVEPGTYAERIELPAGVTLRGREGPARTVLRGDTLSSIVVVRGADSLATVEGFTFSGGGGSVAPAYRAYGGGGILCLDSEVRIRDNVFIGNRLRGRRGVGGGVAVFGGHVILERNRFEDNLAYRGGAVFLKGHAVLSQNDFYHNRAVRHGGGLMVEKAVALVERNIFRENRGGWGGGVCVGHLTEVTLRRNTLIKNRSRQWGGAVFLMDCEPVVERNLMVGNISQYKGGGFAGGVFSYPYMKDNLGWGNIPGNFVWVEDTLDIPNSTHQIIQDPQLGSLPRGDYHPREGGAAAGKRGVIGALDPIPRVVPQGR